MKTRVLLHKICILILSAPDPNKLPLLKTNFSCYYLDPTSRVPVITDLDPDRYKVLDKVGSASATLFLCITEPREKKKLKS